MDALEDILNDALLPERDSLREGKVGVEEEGTTLSSPISPFTLVAPLY